MNDTGDVFRWLAGNSSHRLDIIAQYWQLVASPKDSRSGDYGYSKKDLLRFGANQGADVYKALEKAANHNVSIRYKYIYSYTKVCNTVFQLCILCVWF